MLCHGTSSIKYATYSILCFVVYYKLNFDNVCPSCLHRYRKSVADLRSSFETALRTVFSIGTRLSYTFKNNCKFESFFGCKSLSSLYMVNELCVEAFNFHYFKLYTIYDEAHILERTLVLFWTVILCISDSLLHTLDYIPGGYIQKDFCQSAVDYVCLYYFEQNYDPLSPCNWFLMETKLILLNMHHFPHRQLSTGEHSLIILTGRWHIDKYVIPLTFRKTLISNFL